MHKYIGNKYRYIQGCSLQHKQHKSWPRECSKCALPIQWSAVSGHYKQWGRSSCTKIERSPRHSFTREKVHYRIYISLWICISIYKCTNMHVCFISSYLHTHNKICSKLSRMIHTKMIPVVSSWEMKENWGPRNGL